MNLRNVKPFLLSALLLCAALARAATIDVQAVIATDPGKRATSCPFSLTKYRTALLSSPFGAFADGGKQTVQLSAAAPHAQAGVGAFNLDFTLKGPNKIEVIVKDGDNVILAPFAIVFTKGKPRQIELTGAANTTLVFLSLEKE